MNFQEFLKKTRGATTFSFPHNLLAQFLKIIFKGGKNILIQPWHIQILLVTRIEKQQYRQDCSY